MFDFSTLVKARVSFITSNPYEGYVYFVHVTIHKKNGWHIATSQNLDGLIVFNRDFAKLTQEIPACIKLLHRVSSGKEVEVEHCTKTKMRRSVLVFKVTEK